MSQLSRIAERLLVGLKDPALNLVRTVLLRQRGALRATIDEWRETGAALHRLTFPLVVQTNDVLVRCFARSRSGVEGC
jgi:hypothetical protein